jgi:flagellar biosynthesis/type III secretory pathway protein FliH
VFDAVLYLVNLLREPDHESLRQAFKELILKVLSAELAPIAEVFDHPEDPMTAREHLKKWYDDQKRTLRAEGVKQGRAEGVKEGRAEGVKQGRAEGQRKLLAKLLRLKFGPLDAASEERLAGATPAQLGKWAERVLKAESLDQVWS